MIWNTIIGFIPKVLGSAVEAHKTNKQAKEAQAKRIWALKERALEAEIEQIQLGNAVDRGLDQQTEQRISWADDLTLVLFLSPLVGAFIPPAVPHIREGFAVLESMPAEYKYAVGMMLVSVWGYRTLVVPIIKARLGVK